MSRLSSAWAALAGRPITAPRRRGLVASGRRIPRPEQNKPAGLTGGAKWQESAWRYNDEIGFLKSTNNQVADSSSRVRVYPAAMVDPTGDPVPLDEAVGVDGITQSLADDAEAAYARIRNEAGTIRELQRRAVLNLNVPGDCVLVGEEDGAGGETWELHSSGALSWANGKWKVKTGPNDSRGRELDPDRTNIVHIMRPHAQWPSVPDSNMRGLLGPCELLTYLARGDMAVAQSRIANAGILFVSNDLEVAGLGASDLESDSDPFVDALGDGMMAAIRDPASADAVVPLIVRADGMADDRIKQVNFDRPLTEETLRKIDSLILWIARGLYAPPEWTLGIGDSSTYATARVVDREGYLRYLDPTVLEWCAGLTTGWVRPCLLEAGHPPALVDKVVMWRDPASILARAEPVVAKDRGVDLLRAQTATPNEIRAEYGWPALPGGDDLLTPEQVSAITPQPSAGGPGGDEDTNPNAGDPDLAVTAAIDAASWPAALTAPAGDRAASRLGRIDRALFDRVHALADKALTNGLNIAGARLRAQASARTSPFRDRVHGVPAHEVTTALGRGGVEVLTAGDPGPLFDGAFDRYRDDFDSAVAAAQAQAVRVAHDLASDPFDDAEWTAAQAEDRDRGWVVFLSLVGSVAVDRLLQPTVPAPPTGEFDPTRSVSGSLARTVLAVAGGAPAPTSTTAGGVAGAGGGPATGVATGPRVSDLLRSALGATFQGWVWVHGDPPRPFEPHEALDGVVFQGWEDPVLANAEGWPAVEFYRPGDHDGCTCTFGPGTITLPEA